MNDTLKNLYAVVEDRKANPQEIGKSTTSELQSHC